MVELAGAITTYAVARLEQLEVRLLLHREINAGRTDSRAELERRLAVGGQRVKALEETHPGLPSVRLTARLSLNPIEDEVLWLLAGVVLDSGIADLVSDAHPKKLGVVTPALCGDLFVRGRRPWLESAGFLSGTGRLGRAGLIEFPEGLSDPTASPLRPAGFLPYWLLAQRRLENSNSSFARRFTPQAQVDQIVLRSGVAEELCTAAKILARPMPSWSGLQGPEVYDFQNARALLITGARGHGKSLATRVVATRAGASLIEVNADALGVLSAKEAAEALSRFFAEAECCGDWLVLDGCNQLLADSSSDHEAHSNRGLPELFARLLQERQVRVVDVAPTLCHLLGLPMPRDVEGGIIYEALEDPDWYVRGLPG